MAEGVVEGGVPCGADDSNGAHNSIKWEENHHNVGSEVKEPETTDAGQV